MDYPRAGTRCVVRVGDKELVTESLDKCSPVTLSFRVTRMRCWRISGMLPPPGGDGRAVPKGGSRRKRATVLRLNGNDDYYGAESDGEEEEDEGVREDLRP